MKFCNLILQFVFSTNLEIFLFMCIYLADASTFSKANFLKKCLFLINKLWVNKLPWKRTSQIFLGEFLEDRKIKIMVEANCQNWFMPFISFLYFFKLYFPEDNKQFWHFHYNLFNSKSRSYWYNYFLKVYIFRKFGTLSIERDETYQPISEGWKTC